MPNPASCNRSVEISYQLGLQKLNDQRVGNDPKNAFEEKNISRKTGYHEIRYSAHEENILKTWGKKIHHGSLHGCKKVQSQHHVTQVASQGS